MDNIICRDVLQIICQDIVGGSGFVNGRELPFSESSFNAFMVNELTNLLAVNEPTLETQALFDQFIADGNPPVFSDKKPPRWTVERVEIFPWMKVVSISFSGKAYRHNLSFKAEFFGDTTVGISTWGDVTLRSDLGEINFKNLGDELRGGLTEDFASANIYTGDKSNIQFIARDYIDKTPLGEILGDIFNDGKRTANLEQAKIELTMEGCRKNVQGVQAPGDCDLLELIKAHGDQMDANQLKRVVRHFLSRHDVLLNENHLELFSRLTQGVPLPRLAPLTWVDNLDSKSAIFAKDGQLLEPYFSGATRQEIKQFIDVANDVTEITPAIESRLKHLLLNGERLPPSNRKALKI